MSASDARQESPEMDVPIRMQGVVGKMTRFWDSGDIEFLCASHIRHRFPAEAVVAENPAQGELLLELVSKWCQGATARRKQRALKNAIKRHRKANLAKGAHLTTSRSERRPVRLLDLYEPVTPLLHLNKARRIGRIRITALAPDGSRWLVDGQEYTLEAILNAYPNERHALTVLLREVNPAASLPRPPVAAERQLGSQPDRTLPAGLMAEQRPATSPPRGQPHRAPDTTSTGAREGAHHLRETPERTGPDTAGPRPTKGPTDTPRCRPPAKLVHISLHYGRDHLQGVSLDGHWWKVNGYVGSVQQLANELPDEFPGLVCLASRLLHPQAVLDLKHRYKELFLEDRAQSVQTVPPRRSFEELRPLTRPLHNRTRFVR